MTSEQLYDKLFDEVATIFNDKTICNMKSGYCRKYNKMSFTYEPYTYCCSGCKYHAVAIGCTTKSIWCKLWVCSSVVNYRRDIVGAVNRLIDKVYQMHIPYVFRGSKEEILSLMSKDRR